jgi:PAS domain S-box-containing protein
MRTILSPWNRLTAPSASLTQPDERRKAKLLASLLLLILALAWIIEIIAVLFPALHAGDAGHWFTLGLSLLLLLAYAISRTRHYRWAAGLIVTISTFQIFFLAVYRGPAAPLAFLDSLALPILLASYFFSHLTLIAVVEGILLMLLILPRFLLGVPPIDVIAGPFTFIAVLSVFILLLTEHRDHLEADRQRVLARSEEELRQAYASMERLVDERTSDLEETNELLQAEIIERGQIAENLRTRLEMEKLVADLSTSFLNLPTEKTDEAIQHALQALGELTGTQRVFVFLLSEDEEHISMKYEWCAPGVQSPMSRLQNLPVRGFPSWERDLRDLRPVHIPEVEAMPDALRMEREFMRALGTRTSLLLPLVSLSDLTGLMGFDSQGQAKAWKEEDILQMGTAAEILARALSRRVVEEDRRLGRLALAESEARYRAVSELTSDYAYAFAVDREGRLELDWVTEAMVRGLGITLETSSSIRGMIRHVHPEDRGQVLETIRVLLSNQPCAAEFRLLLPGGEVRTLHNVGRPVWDEGQGRVVRIYGAAQDITERKQAEEALQQAYEEMEARVQQRTRDLNTAYNQMRTLLSAIASILVGVDADGRVTHWNETAEEALGLPAGQAVGRPLAELGIPWEWGEISAAVSRCQERRQKVRLGELLVTRADGSTRVLAFTLNPIVDEQNPQRAGIIFHGSDITERKKMEQGLAQSQKLQSIGQLAAGIAHEINTPAQFVASNLRFLKQGIAPISHLLEQLEELRGLEGTAVDLEMVYADLDTMQLDFVLREFPQAIDQSLEGIERIAGIVRAMRDFSHPGSEHKIMADINRGLESTIAVARNEWKLVAEVKTDLDPNLPRVECLPAQLNQAFLNLLINAVQAVAALPASGNGERGLITVSTRRLPPGERAASAAAAEAVEISFADSGCGISPEIQGRIFDPFFTTKEVGVGTGQGLAIVHNIVVNQHGGSVSFESAPGKGAVFTIRLPVRAV